MHSLLTCMCLLAGAANGSPGPDVKPKGHVADQVDALAISTGSAAGSSSDVSRAASAVELMHMEGVTPRAALDPEAGLVSAAAAEAAPGGREDGCAVVLTTHSMEEVEVLCSRVGIMHRGRLACLGSPQRLKALYGGARICKQHDAQNSAYTQHKKNVSPKAWPSYIFALHSYTPSVYAQPCACCCSADSTPISSR